MFPGHLGAMRKGSEQVLRTRLSLRQRVRDGFRSPCAYPRDCPAACGHPGQYSARQVMGESEAKMHRRVRLFLLMRVVAVSCGRHGSSNPTAGDEKPVAKAFEQDALADFMSLSFLDNSFRRENRNVSFRLRSLLKSQSRA